MKKVYLIGALLSFGLLAEAQSFMRFEDKASTLEPKWDSTPLSQS